MFKFKYIILIIVVLLMISLYKPIKLNFLIITKLNNAPESVEAKKAINKISKYNEYALPYLAYWLGKDPMITTNIISCFELITQKDSLSSIVYENGKSDTLLLSPQESIKKKEEEISVWRKLIREQMKSKK